MLVPSEFRKCVAYLTVDAVDEDTGVTMRQPAGSAFFVSVPVEDIGYCTYLITARHVIDASRPYGQIYARVNLPTGGFLDAPVPNQDKWEMHPTTDVAAVSVAIDTEKLDVKSVGIAMFLTDERIASAEENPLGEGDEVVLIGLFTSNPGTSRSEPVVRFGHIARMPYEQIPIKMDPAEDSGFVPVKAYLAEAAAYGGQSGSPAFVYFAPDRVPGVIQIGGPTGGGYALLGLVHGHYPHKQKVTITSGDVTGEGKIDFNFGLSVVIPAQDILTVLDSEEFMKQRKDAADTHRAKNAPTSEAPASDSGLGQPDNPEFEQFESLARELVKMPKKELDEKRKAKD